MTLCALITEGAALDTARAEADLDLHMVEVKERVMDNDQKIRGFILDKFLSKFVDVVGVDDVKMLFEE